MIIDDALLDSIQLAAKASPRLRMNFNLHKNLDAPVQRLLNDLEPGTVMPVHRHCTTDETYALLRGHIKVTFYNNDKTIQTVFDLNPREGRYGVNIPQNTWHTLEVLESSVIFEVKQGPYTPLTPENILDV